MSHHPPPSPLPLLLLGDWNARASAFGDSVDTSDGSALASYFDSHSLTVLNVALADADGEAARAEDGLELAQRRLVLAREAAARHEECAAAALRDVLQLPVRRLHLSSERCASLLRFLGEVGASKGRCADAAGELHKRFAELRR